MSSILFTKEEAIAFIKEEYENAWNNYSKTFNLAPYKKPECIIINKSIRIAGFAYRNCNKVEFNLAYCMTEKDKFSRTIYHEVAHIVQFLLFPNAKQAHGSEFRHIMNSQGLDGSTYHTYSVTKAKAVAKATEFMLIDDISSEEW